MRLGVLTASSIAPFLGAVQIPLIHLLKLVVSNVVPLSQLPTTKQVVGNGHLQPIWTGKIKKPCIYKQITELLKHSWTGNFLPRNLFDVLDLLAHLLNQYLKFNGRLCDVSTDRF